MSEIKLQCGSTAAVISTVGAEMISFRGENGREIIWQADPKVWAGHAPVLFPTIGFSKENKTRIDGVTYPSVKHGLVRKAEFQIDKIGEDFVDLVFTSNNATREIYPFEFAFHVVYTLRRNGFSLQFVVENCSDKQMPFTVGGHPAFIVPMEDGASFIDYELVFPEKEDGRNLTLNADLLIGGEEMLDFAEGCRLPLDHNLIDPRDTLIFSGYNSRSVDLVHKVSRHGLRISYPKMEVLAVWSAGGKFADYVCLEPWHGLPSLADESGNFEDKPFATILKPGLSHQCGYDVELI